MPRWAFAVAGALILALIASQILLPGIGERRVEDRLTENGGSAEVDLGAIPALRLLFGDGERFEVEASGLDLELDQRVEVFDRLDGFGIVDVSIADFEAGPLEVESFELSRDGDETYRLLSAGVTTASELLDYGAESLALPGGGLAGVALDRLLGEDDLELPFELDMELASEDGRVQVVSGGGTVAGLPTGPLAQLITAAIVVRL